MVGEGPIHADGPRLCVFVSLVADELAEELAAAREAFEALRLTAIVSRPGSGPGSGATASTAAERGQCRLFVGIYGERYGSEDPGGPIGRLEADYRAAEDRPRLLYVRSPAPARDPRLEALLALIREEGRTSYKAFSSPRELRRLLADDLAILLSETFDRASTTARDTAERDRPPQSGPGGLPLPPSPLVDREVELPEVSRLLLDEDVRLVTLTGPGGCGKTRLAVEAGAVLADHFDDGPHYVDLAPLDAPALVTSAIASALAVRELNDGRSLGQALEDRLRDKRMLLVLDNFERVVTAAGLVAELLAGCRHLRVLVTSRIPLRVRGEHEYVVAPLPLPPREADSDAPEMDAPEMMAYGAVALFVRQMLNYQQDRTVDRSTLGTVAEICRRLDGLPLAIELAAARTRVLSPEAMLERVDRRLPLLVGGARDLPARQRTLRDAIEWSYDLLDEDAQRLFRHLAVFSGGWSLEALTAVEGGETGSASFETFAAEDVLDRLEVLLEGNLIRPLTAPGGGSRFGMLETIREYALEKLAAHGEEAEARTRHARYFRDMAENAEPALASGRREGSLAGLDVEIDNLRAALTWSRRPQAEDDTCQRLAGALGWYWFFRGMHGEGRTWLEAAARCARQDEPTVAAAKVLCYAGGLAWAQADLGSARRELERSIELCRGRGSEWEPVLARSLMLLGFTLVNLGDQPAAVSAHEESLAISSRLGDRWVQALTLSNLGDAALLGGDPAAARGHYEEGLAIFAEIDDSWGRSIVHYSVASLSLFLGDPASARRSFEEGAALSSNAGDRWGEGRLLLGQATAELSLGDAHSARLLFEHALRACYEVGNRGGMLMCLAGLAATAHEPSAAAWLAGRVDAAVDEIGARLWVSLQPLYRRGIDSIRSTSEAEGWADNYVAGRSAPLEQVVADALRGPDEPGSAVR